MNLLDHIAGFQEIGFAGAGSRTSDIDSGHGPLFDQHHGTSCGSTGVGEVSNANAADIGEASAVGQGFGLLEGGDQGRGGCQFGKFTPVELTHHVSSFTLRASKFKSTKDR